MWRSNSANGGDVIHGANWHQRHICTMMMMKTGPGVTPAEQFRVRPNASRSLVSATAKEEHAWLVQPAKLSGAGARETACKLDLGRACSERLQLARLCRHGSLADSNSGVQLYVLGSCGNGRALIRSEPLAGNEGTGCAVVRPSEDSSVDWFENMRRCAMAEGQTTSERVSDGETRISSTVSDSSQTILRARRDWSTATTTG